MINTSHINISHRYFSKNFFIYVITLSPLNAISLDFMMIELLKKRLQLMPVGTEQNSKTV